MLAKCPAWEAAASAARRRPGREGMHSGSERARCRGNPSSCTPCTPVTSLGRAARLESYSELGAQGAYKGEATARCVSMKRQFERGKTQGRSAGRG